MIKEKKYVINNKKLMAEWNLDKNNKLELNPKKLTLGSNKKVWWICLNCKYEWQTSIHNRNSGTGCPICSKTKKHDSYLSRLVFKKNSLFDKYPEVSKEWDYQKNHPLTPKDITYGSGKKVWWICSQGHSWRARVDHRTNGSGCIYCSKQKSIPGVNDLATLYPSITSEWDYEQNKELKPENFLPNSNKKVFWICPLGHQWKTSISHRTNGTMCPKCFKEYGTSFAEQSICFYLSQYTEVLNRIKINNFEIDIFLPNYNIGFEYDGYYYHSSQKKKNNDRNKDIFFENSNIQLYRIKESDKNEFNIQNKTIYCIPDKKYEYIKYVLKQIEKILNFEISFIDIVKDCVKIYSQYIKSVKENSLFNTNKKLCFEWDYSKNINLSPKNFTPGSSKRVWWICPKCKSSYIASIGHRSNGTNCPYCSGKKINETNNLKKACPSLVNLWDYKQNKIKMEDVYFNSRKKVWWVCQKCQKSYKRSICSMIKSKTLLCKECMHKIIGFKNQKNSANKNGSLETTYPNLVSEWDFKQNKNLTPDLVSFNSGKKVWWKCKVCGNCWQAIVRQRVKGYKKCPNCKKSQDK